MQIQPANARSLVLYILSPIKDNINTFPVRTARCNLEWLTSTWKKTMDASFTRMNRRQKQRMMEAISNPIQSWQCNCLCSKDTPLIRLTWLVNSLQVCIGQISNHVPMIGPHIFYTVHSDCQCKRAKVRCSSLVSLEYQKWSSYAPAEPRFSIVFSAHRSRICNLNEIFLNTERLNLRRVKRQHQDFLTAKRPQNGAYSPWIFLEILYSSYSRHCNHPSNHQSLQTRTSWHSRTLASEVHSTVEIA